MTDTSPKALPEEANVDAAWQALAHDIKGCLADILGIDTANSPYTRSAFVNSIAGKVERLAHNGEITLVDNALNLVRAYNATHKKPAISERHKFWTFGDLAREKAVKHNAAVSREPEAVAAGDGVDVINNHHLDRVQIVFAAKPSVAMIGMLKSEGWNWSRTQGAWQRKLTEAARESAKRITGIG
jgi:hypothetical protein